MDKLKKSLIVIAVCYAIGLAASFALVADVEIGERLWSLWTQVGLGAGLLFAVMIMLDNSSKHKETSNFSGKTEGGDKMSQHYNAHFVTEKELATNPKFMPNTFRSMPMVKKTGTFMGSLYKNGSLRVIPIYLNIFLQVGFINSLLKINMTL